MLLAGEQADCPDVDRGDTERNPLLRHQQTVPGTVSYYAIQLVSYCVTANYLCSLSFLLIRLIFLIEGYIF